VVGHSGGGPHALACGVRLADRISRLGVVCGFAPMDRPGATQGMSREMRTIVPVLRRAPWVAGPMLRSLPDAYRRDARAAWEAQFGRNLPPCDRAELEVPTVYEGILTAAVEAVRPGAQGIADELPLFLGRSWQFDPTEITVPTWLWYGEADIFAPVQMGRYLAQVIPGATLTHYGAEGHMVYIRHWAEILRTVGG